MDTSVVFNVVCQTYIYYTTEVFISVLRSPLHASGSLPSSAGGFITVSLKTHAKKNGETLNSFINRAINETMERDDQKMNCQEKEPYSPLPETDTRNTQSSPDNAPGKTFEERREQLLKEYEALASTSGQEMSGSPAGSRHKQPESDPVTSPYETLDEKLERLRKEHSTQAPIGSNE